MNPNDLLLEGRHVRLEPLGTQHVAGLVAASAGDPELYTWSFVPRGEAAVRRYVDDALALAREGRAVPFATVRRSDGRVIGSTRFFDLSRWAWNHDSDYDTAEIGYTWLAHDAIRTAVNTEAKLLMLSHAFETWRLQSVCLHTDARNARSRAAIERIGGRFEGILRAHRLASDLGPRDSARYSIVASEWPELKAQIAARLAPG